jgi:hypothetical protein
MYGIGEKIVQSGNGANDKRIDGQDAPLRAVPLPQRARRRVGSLPREVLGRFVGIDTYDGGFARDCESPAKRGRTKSGSDRETGVQHALSGQRAAMAG